MFSEKLTEFAGQRVEVYSPEVGILLPVLPRREFRWVGGGTDPARVWTIALDGTAVTVAEGTAGTAAAPATTTYPTPADAHASYRRRILDRVQAGWTPAEKPAPESLRAALMAALATNPDDRASQMAFADFLAEQGEEVPAIAYRIEQDGETYDEEDSLDHLRAFLTDPAVSLVRGLIIGFCFGHDQGDAAAVVAELLAARDRLVNLRALFLGDLTYSDNELSWINLTDLTDLLTAFPKLEVFRSRGGGSLVVRPFTHENLRSLTFEASNLPRGVVQAVGASRLPALEHLELWLGTDRYGADTTPDDLASILSGDGLPSLRSLGLRNSEIVNDIVPLLANAPIMKRIRTLDLSLGTLDDRGGLALLAIPEVANLDRLDIHHHYVSPPLVAQLEALSGTVDASDAQGIEDPNDPTAYRYVAHTE